MILLSDFDGTITTKDSISTIGFYNKAFPEYKKELISVRNDFLNSNLDAEEKTLGYAKKELELLSKYLKENSYVNDSLYDLFRLRKGFNDLVKFTKDYGYELIISSSGIGNVILEVLKRNNIDNSNIRVISNFYDSNYDFDLKNIVYSRKKYNNYILSKKNENFILIGNHPCDRNMLPLYLEPTLSIGFCDKIYECFNYNLEEKNGFDDVVRLIKKA